MNKKHDFLKGFKALTPLLVGVFPFAVISGIAAIDAGLTSIEAMSMASIVYAGTAQLASVQLIGSGASTLVVIITALVINFRMFMYSASLSPYFVDQSKKKQVLLSYLLTDQTFGVTINKFSNEKDYMVDKFWFYLGASIPMWLTWQIGTLLGIVLGSGIPDSLGLDFAVPLCFLTLMFKSINDKQTGIAAIIASVSAILAFNLPLNLGMIFAAFIGIFSGLIYESVYCNSKSQEV